jgi:hypothetical protein
MEFLMRITPGSNQKFVLRMSQLVALSGSLALFACQDATSPEDAKSTTLAAPSLIISIGNNTTPLGEMGLTLVDATNWVLPSINSTEIRATMETTLQSLATHIGMGQYALAREDVTVARVLMTKLDVVDTAEAGPIGVSLDEIDAGLKKISY